MPKHTLFICQSCRRSAEDHAKTQPADGMLLLQALNPLGVEQFQSDEFEIQSVGCLWACSQGCVVAFSALNKPTYLVTNLPAIESVPALLQFGEQYFSSNNGDVPWKQIPELLQTAGIAKIPTVIET